MLKPRPYQEQAADFLYEHDRAMILAPVGAGKTMITLTAMQAMLKDGHAKRFLVLAPKRVATSVWPVEQAKWAPDVTLAVAVKTAMRSSAIAHLLLLEQDQFEPEALLHRVILDFSIWH